MQSISGEVSDSGLDVGVHTLSPGMVLTELLLDGATTANKQVFNVLCEQPEVVAAYLVPRVRSVAARNSPMTYIRSLTSTQLPPFMRPRVYSSTASVLPEDSCPCCQPSQTSSWAC